MEDTRLYFEEIQQLHNTIKDFSNHSISIKKISISIYIGLFTIFFTIYAYNKAVPKYVFLIVGILFPLFCYFYEIYYDYVRQKLRGQMNNMFRKVEELLGKEQRTEKTARATILGVDIDLYPHLKIEWHKNAEKKNYYYINLLHLMYLIYLFEIIATIALVFSIGD